MATRILIVGMNPFDSGKTTLAIQLGSRFRSEGLSFQYFKPVSGHNYWFRYPHSVRCVREKRIVSYDATRFDDAMGSDVPILLRNPVHSLFVPARLDTVGKCSFSTLGLAGWDSYLAMQRFSCPLDQEIATTILVADELIDRQRLLLSTAERDALTGGDRRVSVASIEEVQEYERQHLDECVSSSFAVVEARCSLVLIESFNDSVWPWSGLDRVDVVLAVGPGHVFQFDPEKIRRAVDYSMRSGQGARFLTFAGLSDLVRPVQKYELRAEVGLDDSALSYMTRSIK